MTQLIDAKEFQELLSKRGAPKEETKAPTKGKTKDKPEASAEKPEEV